MRVLLGTVLAILLLGLSAAAAEVPAEVEKALPDSADKWMQEVSEQDGLGLTKGIAGLLGKMRQEAGKVFREQLKGTSGILLTVLLCSAVRAGSACSQPILRIAGALSVSVLTSGSVHGFMALGERTIQELSDFAEVLLPALAAATAAAGGVSMATVQQVVTVFFADLLIHVTQEILLPIVSFYVALLTVGSCLSENSLSQLAEGCKRGISWLLTGSLLLFTGYLSAVRVISGTADRTAVKVTRAALKGLIPVVGGIVSEAAETVLVGAGMLRNSIGIFGTLGILGACAYPFLKLGIQFLLYKLAGFLASVIGEPELCGLIRGLGGAFGLILGMVGSCAILLLIAVFSAVAAVIP